MKRPNIQKPRLAIYLPSLRGGGAERAMATLANAFVERGYAVDLVLAKAEGPYLKEIVETVNLVDLNSSRVATSLPSLVRYLRREKPKAMLSAMAHANMIALIARALARVPMRVVVSERSSPSMSISRARNLRGRILGRCTRYTYRFADGIIAVSEGVADDLSALIGIPRHKIDVVFNPVVNERLRYLAEKPATQPWLTFGDGPLVLSAGRLTREKRFDILIRAFGRLRTIRPVRLVIMGEGNLRNGLVSEVERLGLTKDVTFPGFVENPFSIMRRANLFVLSSEQEGLPNVLIQAMACGLPVVSTDCPYGPTEILEEGRWGRLVSVGDVEALAEAMAATLEEVEHPDVEGRAARFNVAQAVDGYLSVMLPDGTRSR